MKKIMAFILLTAVLITSAAAVTPALILDKATFYSVDRTAENYVEPQSAGDNKTSTKQVSVWFENREWGYLHINWKHKSKARGYQIEVAKDRSFNNCVRADVGMLYNHATYEGRMTTFKSGQAYFVRVRATYKNDKVGKWSKIVKYVKR